MAVTHRKHQRRVAGRVQPEYVGAPGDQQLNNGRMSLLRGQMEWPAPAIPEIVLLENARGTGTAREKHRRV